MTRRVVLLGAGRAHVQVLHELARAPVVGAEVMLLTSGARHIHSSLVPGLVAGHYTPGACTIALAPLAAACGARLVEGQAVALDAAARRVHLADGHVAEYEVLSLGVGATMDRQRLPGAREHGLFVRPIEHFVQLLDPLFELAARRVLDVVVIGAGAAGVELALALQYRLGGRDGDERARVALVTGGPPPLQGHDPGVMRRGAAALAARRITVFRERCIELRPGAVVLASGARLACDAPVLATGPEAPPWLAGSGLALDEKGFVRTGPTLQSSSHPEVFAVGDVASRSDAPQSRNGAQALRAGPALALNLRRFVAGGSLQPYAPPQRTLELVACGERRAIVGWGSCSAQGAWGWWWKDRIDRAFVARCTAAGARATPGVAATGPRT